MLPVHGKLGEGIMAGRWSYLAGALVLAFTVAAAPLQAQRGQGFRGQAIGGRGGPNLGQSLDVALAHQDDLDLTQDQVVQLKELKGVIDGDVADLAEEMKVVREGLRGGDVDRDEGLRRMQALRGELMTASAPLRGRVQEILTVEQHNALQPLVWQGGPGSGRAGTLQGRGVGLPVGRGRGMGVQGQPRGVRGGGGPQVGFMGQGRASAPGFRQGHARFGLRRTVGPVPKLRRGWGGGNLVGGGSSVDLP